MNFLFHWHDKNIAMQGLKHYLNLSKQFTCAKKRFFTNIINLFSHSTVPIFSAKVHHFHSRKMCRFHWNSISKRSLRNNDKCPLGVMTWQLQQFLSRISLLSLLSTQGKLNTRNLSSFIVQMNLHTYLPILKAAQKIKDIMVTRSRTLLKIRRLSIVWKVPKRLKKAKMRHIFFFNFIQLL